jgi:D-psicose/D-tagatose/L-ribulose 3-epimerase
MNQIGIHLSYWQENWSDELQPLIIKAFQSGYDLVEFPLLLPLQLDYSRLRNTLDELGMVASCSTGLSSKNDITDPSSTTRKAGIDHLRACIEGASRLGSPVLAGLTYAGWGVFPSDDRMNRWNQCIESLRIVSQIGKDYGITICLEVVNRFEGYLLNTVEQGLDLLAELSCSNIKLHLDTFHLNIEENCMGDAIRSAGPWLGHFHANENNRKAPGIGHIPWQAVAQSLKAINYQGFIVSETFINPTGEVGYGMNIWQLQNHDLDIAAKSGLGFLQRVFNNV